MKKAMVIRALTAVAVSVAAVFAVGAALLVHAGYPDYINLLAALSAGVLIVAAVFVVASATSLERQLLRPVRRAVEVLCGAGAAEHLSGSPDPLYAGLPAELAELGELAEGMTEKFATLEAERRRVDFTLSNMNEGLVVLSHELRIELINKSARAFFGAQEDLDGLNLLRLTHQPAVAAAARRAVEEGERGALDIKSGERKLQLLISPVQGDGLRLKNGAIILITDVTAIRRAEQIRSEFVANVSHELKTPLTSIRGFTELMESGLVEDPAQRLRYLGLIREEAYRMTSLINDILKLSELESVVTDSNKKTVSLKMIAQRVAESLSVQAGEHEVTIGVEGDTGMLEANPDRMTELVLNLADNAVKYNRPGGKVTVTVMQGEREVVLAVSDTGLGIPEESQERVFERFYRVDKSRSRRQGGTGLGLSIVKHIVGLYRGRIELQSAPGEGTTIRVTLPAGGEQAG